MGKVNLTILGSGTFVPFKNRTCPSHLIDDGKNKIIFDFGRGAISNLTELGIELYEIENIFISHTHADHFSDLIPFFQFIINAPEKKKLKPKYNVYGPSGTKKVLGKILEALYPNGKKNLDRLNIIDLKKEEQINIGNFKIKGFEVKHSKTHLCFGYKIIIGNKKICYSGDSSYCKNLVKNCKDTDLGLIEATYFKEANITSHLNGEDVGKLAKECKIKKLVAVHVASDYLARVKKDIKKNYKGKILIAKDLMRIKI